MTLSHFSTTKPPEKLEEHKSFVKKYLDRIIEFKNIDLNKLVEVFEIKDKEFVEKFRVKYINGLLKL